MVQKIQSLPKGIKTTILTVLTLTILLISNVSTFVTPVAHAAAAAAPVVGGILLEFLKDLGIVVVTGAAAGGTAYGISQAYPYIYDMFQQSGYGLEEWLEKTFGGIYNTDGNGKYWVGNHTDYPVTESSQLVMHASALVDKYTLPVNVSGNINAVPLTGNVGSTMIAGIPVDSIYDSWIIPYYQIGPSTTFPDQASYMGLSHYLTRIRKDHTGIDTWAFGADMSVPHNSGYSIVGDVPPYFWFYPDIGGSTRTGGIMMNYWYNGGFANDINTGSAGSSYWGSDVFVNFSSMYDDWSAYPFYTTSGEKIPNSQWFYNGKYSSGKFDTSTATIKSIGVIVGTANPKWNIGFKEKEQEIDMAPDLDGVYAVIDDVKPPKKPDDDDDEPDKDAKYYPPDWWKLFESLADIFDDSKQNTTVEYYVQNNFTFNITNNPAPEYPTLSDFNVHLEHSGDLNIKHDVDLSGGLNIDITINDKTELPSISEGDGDDFFSAGVVDVFAGLTKNNPVLETLKELLSAVDPALVSIFSVSVSLVLLLAIWKLIRG